MNAPIPPLNKEAAPTCTSGTAIGTSNGTYQDTAASQNIRQQAPSAKATYDPKLSRTKRAASNALTGTTLHEFFAEVRSGKHAKQVAEVRKAYREGGKKAAKPFKDELPAVLISGRFNALQDQQPDPHSGCIVADLDELGDKLPAVRERARKSPYLIGDFVSPTGSGLKLIFRCDPNREHRESFEDVAEYCRCVICKEVDRSGSNVNRLCFLSHDPDALLRPDAEIIPPRQKGAGQKPITTLNDSQPPLEGVTEQAAKDALSQIDPACCRDTWIRVAMGLKHQFGEEGYTLWDSWSKDATNVYPGGAETRKQWDSLKQHPIGKDPVTYRTVQHLAGLKRDIILPGAGVTITGCAKDLFGRIAHGGKMFVRGGVVHEVWVDGDETRLSPVDPVAFQSAIEGYGRVVRAGKKPGLIEPCTCPRNVAEVLLKSEVAHSILPGVDYLFGCPVLAKTPSGPQVLGSGWHSQRVFVTGGEIPPTVPLSKAVQELQAILGDFDFVHPSDNTRALAALIAPAMVFGGWIDRHPFQIVTADDSQTGKGYLLQCIAAIYRETPNLVTQRNGGVGGVDESIDQRLIQGRPFIQLDNWRRSLDSPRLEALITAPGTVGARVPHKAEIDVNPTKFVFQLTSNGFNSTADIANRASFIRLKKRPSGHVFRSYPAGDLLRHLKANQPHYLGCVFAVIREWVENGEPGNGDTGHSFRDWAQKVGCITDNMFMAQALLGGMDEAVKSMTDPGDSWLRALVHILDKSRSAGAVIAPLSASELAEEAIRTGHLPPGITRGEVEKCRQRIGQIMKERFGDKDEIRVEGKILRRNHSKKPNGDDLKTYEVVG